MIFVSWGSNLSPAPSAWLDWLLPARLVFVTPVSLRGSALVFSPTPEPGYLGLAALREGNPLAFAFGFGLLPFPCRGSAKVLVPSPGKDLSRQRPLGGKRSDADVAGPKLQPARSRLRLGSLQLPCRVFFGLTSKPSPEIKTLTGISVGKLPLSRQRPPGFPCGHCSPETASAASPSARSACRAAAVGLTPKGSRPAQASWPTASSGFTPPCGKFRQRAEL